MVKKITGNVLKEIPGFGACSANEFSYLKAGMRVGNRVGCRSLQFNLSSSFQAVPFLQVFLEAPLCNFLLIMFVLSV